SQPSEVITASDGSASVSYIAGPTSTGANGVVIRAQVISPVTSVSATASLTVSQRSLFITAGTGNLIESPTSATYQKDYVVFVTDASGNPVSGVTVTASARPRSFSKGFYTFVSGGWSPTFTATCLNEDLDSNGVLGSGEDVNRNGRLDPGISLNITPSATTAANGTATITLIYPRDRANWIDIDFIIRGSVSGSESSYVGYVRLPGAAADFNSQQSSPPGSPSPYGTSNSCSDDR
ncbi:MAG: Ig-like group 1 domain-containing protein, partial [Telluria sp.]